MNHDQLSGGFFVCLGILICLHSLSYNLGSLASPEGGMMPFLSGAAITLLAAIGFVHATMRRRRGERWLPLLPDVLWKKTLLTLGALVGFLFLLKPLGFFLDTVFFIAFLLRVIAPHRWAVVIGGAFLTAAASYIVFEIWLKAQLPQGLLGI